MIDAYRKSTVAEYVAPRPRLVPVWLQMAEHFLDTETRPEIPKTAAVCLEAGLDVREARKIWRYDVGRALGPNLFGGEWIGWEEEKVIARIVERQQAIDNEPGWRWLSYWVCAGLSNPVWRSIARVMRFLAVTSNPQRRATQVADLTALATMYFAHNSYALEAAQLPRERQTEALRELYRQEFRWLFAPVVEDESRAKRGHECVLWGTGQTPTSPFA